MAISRSLLMPSLPPSWLFVCNGFSIDFNLKYAIFSFFFLISCDYFSQANVIPSSANVTVNHRVHPGNTLEEVR